MSSTESTTPRRVPNDGEVIAALKEIRASQRSLGLQKVLAELRNKHPDWEIHSKRVRQLQSASNLGPQADDPPKVVPDEHTHTPVVQPSSHASPSRPTAQLGQAPRVSTTRGQPTLDTDFMKDIEGYISNVVELTESQRRPRPPSLRYMTDSNGKCTTFGMRLLNATREGRGGDITFRSLQEIEKADLSDRSRAMYYAPFRMFYAEWDCFLGPDPLEPCAPATPFQRDMEGLLFPTLFPHGVGFWGGPTGHQVPITFEEYAFHLLVLHDFRFRRSKEWLGWVLTRTEDRSLAAAVNCALVVYHNTKARHLGDAAVQWLQVEEDFEPCELVNGLLVPTSV